MTCTFRFLDLSPELRNRIYDFYYADDDATSMISLNNIVTARKSLNQTNCQIHLETSSQHAEAIELFWQTHSFTWRRDDGIPRGIRPEHKQKNATAPTELERRVTNLGDIEFELHVCPHHYTVLWLKLADGSGPGVARNTDSTYDTCWLVASRTALEFMVYLERCDRTRAVYLAKQRGG